MSQKPRDPHSDQLFATQDNWLIRLESKEVKGPYKTNVINRMILEGVFSGQEDIAQYPDGDWISLSKQPEFYESLIESLENPTELDEKKAQKMEAETVIRSSKAGREGLLPDDHSEFDDDDSGSELSTHTEITERQKKSSLALKEKKESEILAEKKAQEILEFRKKQKDQFELEKNKVEQKKQDIFQKIKIPFILIIVSILGYFSFDILQNTKEKTTNVWSLMTPSLNKENNTDSENKKLKIAAVSLLKGGRIDDLLQVQQLLIRSVEGKKSDSESLGLLCMTFYQMWPFTKQVSSDLKAVSAVYQIVKQSSPLSNYADTCHAVYLIVKSQINDGRAVVEKTLDNPEKSFILLPFLYLLKGEFSEEASSLINAEAYYNEALKLFPNWLTAELKLGRILYRQNKYTEAGLVFENILKRNPNYKAALYASALNDLKRKDINKAYLLFEKAFPIKDLVSKELNLESLQQYAHLLIDQKKQVKALEVVRSALAISPSHRALNDMFISLGGENLVIGEAQVSELIIEGDQFFRLADYLAAQGRYRAAFDSDSRNTLLALKIAKSMRGLNQFSDSIKWIDKAISIDSKYFAAYALKADFLMQRYNFLDAEQTLNSALKYDAYNYEILKMMTKLQWKKNNLLQAVNYGSKAYKKFDVDVELLTLMASIYIESYFKPPSSKDAEKNLAEKMSYLENAQKYSARAIEIEPAWPESQITYAKYLFAKEGMTGSEKYYEALVKQFPYTVEYRLALAEFYESQDRINSALEIYKFISETEPKNPKAQLGLARCFKTKLDYNAAIKYYLVGSALDTSDADPMFSVAQLQLEMALSETRPDKAQKLLIESFSRFELVKNNNPNFPKVYYFMAKNKLAQGLYEEARKNIEIEKTKNPNIADPYILSGEMNLKQGQFRECALEYMTVLKLRPISDFYFKAASCHRQSGNIDIAEDLITEGHALETGNFNYFRELAYIHEARGNIKAALQSFKEYLYLTANNSFDAKEIESKIRSLEN